MSLYHSIFLVEPDAATLPLKLIGLHEDPPDRFRNAWIEYHEKPEAHLQVCVYTRTGGNNREDHQENWEVMRALPNYVSDRDDAYDSTYAEIRFTLLHPLTPEHAASLKEQFHAGTLDHGEVWRAALQRTHP